MGELERLSFYYLFGGSVALLPRIAANNAGKNVSIVEEANTNAKMNSALAGGGLAKTVLEKRFVVILFNDFS